MLFNNIFSSHYTIAVSFFFLVSLYFFSFHFSHSISLCSRINCLSSPTFFSVFFSFFFFFFFRWSLIDRIQERSARCTSYNLTKRWSNFLQFLSTKFQITLLSIDRYIIELLQTWLFVKYTDYIFVKIQYLSNENARQFSHYFLSLTFSFNTNYVLLLKKKRKRNIPKQFQRFVSKHETLLHIIAMYITQREIRFDHKNYSIMLNYSLLLLSVQQVFLYSKKKKRILKILVETFHLSKLVNKYILRS